MKLYQEDFIMEERIMARGGLGRGVRGSDSALYYVFEGLSKNHGTTTTNSNTQPELNSGLSLYLDRVGCMPNCEFCPTLPCPTQLMSSHGE